MKSSLSSAVSSFEIKEDGFISLFSAIFSAKPIMHNHNSLWDKGQ
jgi:hypothetical protein